MRDDRIFVRDGRRHHRRTYSVREARTGFVILAILLAIAAWVAWLGAHPDPELFEASAEVGESATVGTGAAARGPLPSGLAPAGWSEGPVGSFDASNLYEKINGREGFYKSFGFEHLWFVALSRGERTIDIELFDQGKVENALGVYAGERAEGTTPEAGPSGLSHFDRNALFLTRGRFYARVIGSEESAEIHEALAALKERLVSSLPEEPLPWAYTLFVGSLGLGPASVSYMPVNAFSFEFAREVYAGLLADGETESFVVRAPDAASAARLAGQFLEGFRGYGKPSPGDRSWIEDRYISTWATARALDAWVVGVRGAPGLEAGRKALETLESAVRGLSPEVVARAQASAGAPEAEVSGDAESAYPGKGQAAGGEAGASDSYGGEGN